MAGIPVVRLVAVAAAELLRLDPAQVAMQEVFVGAGLVQGL